MISLGTRSPKITRGAEMRATTSFRLISRPLEDNGSITSLGRVLQLSETCERMLKELSKAHVLKQCDVPKSEQSRVQMEVGRLLREAFAIGGATHWRAELEDMRVLAPRPKPGSGNTPGSDSNDDGADASSIEF